MSAKGPPSEHAPRNPFTPASTAVNLTSASQSARPVTLPHIPELYVPLEEAFNALLPRASASAPIATVKHAPPGVKPSPFMDALRASANRTMTDNYALAYKSTLSPTLDAFASLSQATDRKDIEKLLTDSWAVDPAVTLQIIWNLRSIHEGKSAREQFYRAYAWLYIHHPRTAIANLRFLVKPTVKRTIKRKAAQEDENDEDIVMVSLDPEKDEDAAPLQEVEIGMPHGYWKDLLNILLLATLDQLYPVSSLDALHDRLPKSDEVKPRYAQKMTRRREKSNAELRRLKSQRKSLREAKEASARARDTKTSKLAKVARLEKHRLWHAKVAEKLASDKKYRALFVFVARLFAEGLARDLDILREIADAQSLPARRVELAFDLTLVGKWAPSIGGSHDRVTSIATPIAELLYASGHLKLPAVPLTQPLTQETAHRIRSAYARWVTAPLRRILQVPEVAMSAGKWDRVRYNRVPSHSMRANKAHFQRHDKERFSAYLLAVAEGKVSISGATLLPHELLEEGISLADKGPDRDIETQVVEAQWTALVERVRESGALPNALAVCDVSGSMGFLGAGRNTQYPMSPAVALSILLSRVARQPWANTFITFSEKPRRVSLDPRQGLVKTAQMMVQADSGMSTNFTTVFTRLILPLAIKFKLPPEDMVQRLFVFSDMQFNNSRLSSSSRWETEHERIKAAFEEAGYVMPEIVYWNLAGSVAKPVTKEVEGVALVSGFSPGMLKVFLENGSLEQEEEIMVESKDGEDAEYDEVTRVEKRRLDPIETMLKALGKESFAGLKVLD